MLEKDRFLTRVPFAPSRPRSFKQCAFIHLKLLVHHMVHSVDVLLTVVQLENNFFPVTVPALSANGAVRHPLYGPGADV